MLDVRYKIQKYKVQQECIQKGRDGWHIFCGVERKEGERGRARKVRGLRRPKKRVRNVVGIEEKREGIP